jgi:hypothetical protein
LPATGNTLFFWDFGLNLQHFTISGASSSKLNSFFALRKKLKVSHQAASGHGIASY